MEQRAAIPVTLPRDNPTQSYWQLEPDEIADLRSTDALPDKADTVIIGSGITGAAVAFNLLSNGARDIVMLEARQASSGATGRNGTSSSLLFFPPFSSCLYSLLASILFLPSSRPCLFKSAYLAAALLIHSHFHRRPHESGVLPLVPRPRGRARHGRSR